MIPDLLLLANLILNQPAMATLPKADPNVVLASHSISMEDRYNNKFVNDVFKDNILLTLHYMNGDISKANQISWPVVESSFSTQFTLKPGEEFTFHDKVLPEYKNVVKTTNAHFNYTEGFKYDGDLTGDGVCHLASLMYWVAKDAGLETFAPSNHNFAKINDIDPIYGVAIQSPLPGGNLYITNSLDKPVTFTFNYNGEDLSINVYKK